ncbi:peptidoglycan-binding domain-containing protein [Nocardia crassostreae]|uniref:peptidoglycan-binding domain-containing protein n=1 Tax=Nocardia crassostreae TaxID=53428 RepID=UPI000833047B|nr:peptidoglycan-binding domain-containing protein [Nocardia crassostreae]
MKLRSIAATSALAAAMLTGAAVPALAAPGAAPLATAASGCDYTYGTPTLAEGSRGDAVKQLQCLLFDHGYDPGFVDGAFGPLTASAVYLFQYDHGLVTDKIVGPKTWTALYS